MGATLRKSANVISWTNNLTAGSGTVAKGALVHIGAGKFGVAVDAIAFGATGELIVSGYFEGGSAIINETVKVGQSMINYVADIITVARLKKQATTTSAAFTINESNLYLTEDITASTAAQTFKFVLK